MDDEAGATVTDGDNVSVHLSPGHHAHANSEHDEDNEDEEDCEESEEAEPCLKYERLSSDLKAILAKDSASCIAVHSKLMALGTHWGAVCLLDAIGNVLPAGVIAASGVVTSAPAQHSITVGQISIDHAGEYVASCSLDGRVIVRGLLNTDNDHNFVMNKTLRSISIDPIFAKPGAGRRFMTGDDRVILHEKTYFSRYKQSVISNSEGPIGAIKWRGRFAAWTCSKGVRVFDVVEEKMISLIRDDTYRNVNTDEVPFRICWSDQFTLFVSLGDMVKIGHVKRRDPNEIKSKDLPEFMVVIEASFYLEDMWISGVAPFNDLVVLLTVPKASEDSMEQTSQKPQLQVVKPLPDDYQEVSSDLLAIRGHEKYRPRDYHLECLVEDQHYFIVSPKDIVVGKPRDSDDHIDWLLSRLQFARALDAAELAHKSLARHTVVSIGRQYLDHLLNTQKDFEAAGQLCTRIFGLDRRLWQDEVYKFARHGALRSVAPHLPRGGDKTSLALEPHIYEMALFEFLKTDPEGFLNMVRLWSPSLYSVSAVTKALVQELLMHPENEPLQRALATLFSFQGKYDKAMAVYLKLGHEDVFALIQDHKLFDAVINKIQDLMELNSSEALKLFLENMDRLPPSTIVDNLLGNDKHLFLYLDALYRHSYEESKKFHGHLVALYADFDPDKLVSFLRSSDHYPIPAALQVCEIRGLTPERIFLLARMGNTREALHLIIREQADIHKAIEFCKEHDDTELWNDLINYSIDKPIFVNLLLHNIGMHVDPRLLIERIECGQEILGLRDSLVKILHDYRLQVSLQEGCQRILVADCFSLLQRQVHGHAHGLAVGEEHRCAVCAGAIVADPSQDAVVFRCHHTFHVDCLGESNVCSLCNKSRIERD